MQTTAHQTVRRSLNIALYLLLVTSSSLAFASPEPSEQTPQLSTYREGEGPKSEGEVLLLLDAAKTANQSNTAGYDVEHPGAYETRTLKLKLRVLEGGDGGSIAFLNTAHFGRRGAAPYLSDVVAPDLKGSFGIGFDVHNPKDESPFSAWGNYMGNPEREISLHFDGRELVKRVAPKEFRGDFADVEVVVAHGIGGADVSVRVAGESVYDKYFVAGLLPYESRIGFFAGTRKDASTQFDVKQLSETVGAKAKKRRAPLHVGVFNHVLTNNSKTAYQTTVDLPPIKWALGRVILTLDIHDAGKDWDEWDRNGEISIFDDEGKKLGIVPFITSYRTPCHWQVDISHFRPLLTGKRKFEIAAGTTFYKNRGYMMSVSLDFYHGAPETAPIKVVPLWHGTAKYKSDENHFRDFFDSRTVEIDDDVRQARIVTTTTGHSQVGEFTRSKRAIVVSAEGESQESERFENVLWKTDCYLNPNRPQFGTWKYSRAGWAPGDVVHPWWIDVSPLLTTSRTWLLNYEPSRYDFSGKEKSPPQAEVNKASHVVRSFLILYGPLDEQFAAPTLRIASVQKDGNAGKAGVRRGDYLATYNGKRIDAVQDLIDAIQQVKDSGAKTVEVVVVRGIKEVTLTLDAGRMGISLGS